jgi:O-antigen/teichoic acid export membrane protein
VSASDAQVFGEDGSELRLLGWNVSTRYLAIAVDSLIGLMMLPFNVGHLGKSAYGLWALTASVTVYFSVLDLGFGGALIKFVAQYRALKQRDALNEILSTMFVVFSLIGTVAFIATCILVWQVDNIFNISPDQVSTGRHLLFTIGSYVAIRFCCNIYGTVVYGFQRYYLNNLWSIFISVVVALVNVYVLTHGHSLTTLVISTTTVRVLALGGFVWNAYRAYPGLVVRPRLFRKARLREVTSFSLYILILDWSAKLNYSADAMVIGATLTTSAVAIWTLGQRMAEVVQQLSYQLTTALFPLVVDSDAAQRHERLRLILTQCTRWSLALAVPLCIGLSIMARPVIEAWVGPSFEESVIVARLLLAVVLVKVGNGSAAMILRGAGGHKLQAYANAITGIVNIGMSLALVHSLGLVGVALGTLIPVGVSAAFVLFPAACRRVGMPVAQAVREGIWPALWPAVGLCASLWVGQFFEPTRLSALALDLIVAGLVYEALFLIGIPVHERRLYWAKLMEILRRRRRVAVAA